MSKLNEQRFALLLDYTHKHTKGKYTLYANDGGFIEAYYDTDFETDNGLEVNEDGYEEYQAIIFRRLTDQTLFEVNCHEIPTAVICDGVVVY